MNKTHALFGIAGALVISAAILEYLWSPDQPCQAPPPVETAAVVPAPPPPVVKHAIPGSEIAFGDLVKMNAALSNGYVPTAGGDVFMRIGLDAAKVAATQRPPMALAIVIDRSGSMDGDKIEKTRSAAKQLVGRLGSADQLAIVSYATDYSVDLPLTRIDRVSRDRIYRIIDDLYVGGGTNLSSGLNAGLSEVRRASNRRVVRRVVLMSDGNANQGETDPAYLARVARKSRTRGLSITTLGVGVDFNEDLMTRLAESGGGAYHYAKNGAAIAKALTAELTGLVGIAARGVEVALELGPGVKLHEVYGYSTEVRGGRTVIPVGDMAGGEHRQIIARVFVDPSKAQGAPLKLSNVSLSYTPAAGETLRTQNGDLSVVATNDSTLRTKDRRPEVLESVEKVLAAQARKEAAAKFAMGRKKAAKAKLRAAVKKTRRMARELKSSTLANQAQELEETLRQVNTFDAASDAGKDLVKRQKYKARVESLY